MSGAEHLVVLRLTRQSDDYSVAMTVPLSAVGFEPVEVEVTVRYRQLDFDAIEAMVEAAARRKLSLVRVADELSEDEETLEPLRLALWQMVMMLRSRQAGIDVEVV